VFRERRGELGGINKKQAPSTILPDEILSNIVMDSASQSMATVIVIENHVGWR